MRLLFKCFACCFALCCILSMTGFYGVRGGLERDVLRLHIIADSDSRQAQELKLRVRDGVLSSSGCGFSECRTKEEALCFAEKNLDKIESCANAVLKKNGSSLTARAYITKMSFDTRIYESFTLPAGTYDTVRIVIGSGQGHNWWCVLFPSLCIGAADDSSLESLGKNEEELITNSENYRIGFKIAELFSFLTNGRL